MDSYTEAHGNPDLKPSSNYSLDLNLINPKRKRRIAAGSGTRVEDVNKLLRTYEQLSKLMRQFKKNPKAFERGMGRRFGMMG